ncbi:hypothetical protein ACOSQ3_016034 [Xanthoceras sorbifolium]
MEEKKKVTFMLLKVDLQCSKCYKKVKKVLCQFPQIQDQMYDEKNNTVMIKVVCCSPEKIRDKICYKGKGSIKSIEILKPPEEKTDQKKKPPEKKRETDNPKDQKAVNPKDQKAVNPPKSSSTSSKPPQRTPQANPPLKVTFEQPPPTKASEQPQLPMGYPPCYPPIPGRTCCSDFYEGRSGGPCYDNQCYGQSVRYYDGYCGRPVYDSWGGGGGGYRGYSGSLCNGYFREENSQSCTIM